MTPQMVHIKLFTTLTCKDGCKFAFSRALLPGLEYPPGHNLAFCRKPLPVATTYCPVRQFAGTVIRRQFI